MKTHEKQTQITANEQKIVAWCLIPFQSAPKQERILTED